MTLNITKSEQVFTIERTEIMGAVATVSQLSGALSGMLMALSLLCFCCVVYSGPVFWHVQGEVICRDFGVASYLFGGRFLLSLLLLFFVVFVVAVVAASASAAVAGSCDVVIFFLVLCYFLEKLPDDLWQLYSFRRVGFIGLSHGRPRGNPS